MPSTVALPPASTADESLSYVAEIKSWFAEEASPYCISALVHAAIFLLLGLTLGTIVKSRPAHQNGVVFDSKIDVAEQTNDPEDVLEFPPPNFTGGETTPSTIEIETTLDPTAPTEATLTITPDGENGNDNTYEPGDPGAKNPLGIPAGSEKGTDGGVFIKGLGPGPAGSGAEGIGTPREGTPDGDPFKNRRPGKRPKGGGITKQTDRAVTAALNWIARHQNRDGSWSIEGFSKNCNYGRCTGPGSAKSDAGATALGLLPFLGAGMHHRNKSDYQHTVARGVDWLLKHQKPDGDLSAGSTHVMYSHGLATIALCEAYGMSQDSRLGFAAQAALNFIEKAQNANDGGWRYKPGDPGDTSVVGWQVMALKSGQMAKLKVNETVLENAKQKWLRGVARGDYQGIFAYQPQREGSLVTMTAVGLLCHEYLGAPKADPGLNEGIEYLLKNLPTNDPGARNIYYWYYATQVIHHVLDERWDRWNRAMRRALTESQTIGDGCDAGSWDPRSDVWGHAGGRLMVTSLACLTLEVYYRHLPLYDLDQQGPRGQKLPAKSN